MTRTLTSSAGVSNRTTVWAAREMLSFSRPVVVLDLFGLTKEMPANKGQTITFRRAKPFSAATTPLQEGITPTAIAFAYEDVTGTLKQYGMLVEITDAIEDTSEDPVLKDATEQCGENMGRTMEALRWGVLRAGTSVIYANGAARDAVNTAISLNKIRAAIRSLKAQKAMPITKILSPAVNYGTSAVEAAFVAVAHTDVESDIRNLAGFVPVAKYGSRAVLHETEIGTVESVRFLLSPDLESFPDAGGDKGSMVSTTGTKADVYPVLIFGKEAYASVPLRGKTAVSPTILRPGVIDKSDPLGQRGYVGWKTWFLALITNQSWMTRLECAVTAL